MNPDEVVCEKVKRIESLLAELVSEVMTLGIGLRATVQVEEDDGQIELWSVALRKSVPPARPAALVVRAVTE